MKQLLKICYLIIFAAIVASVSTSCSNDSELFEEPVMYQTRAMTRTNTGGETMKERHVTNSGNCSTTKNVRVNEGYIEVTFQWSSGALFTKPFTVTEPKFVDTNEENHVEHDFSDPYIYEYEIYSKDPIRKTSYYPYVVEQGGKHFLQIDIVGRIIEHQYDVYTHRLIDVDTIKVNDTYTASEPIKIEWKDVSSNSTTFSTHTLNFEPTDSLTIQNQ